MDQRYDMQRAVKTSNTNTIQYYDPAKPFTQYMNTPEKGAIMVAIGNAYKKGTLPGTGKKLMQSSKPVEELFDVASDPYELNNLAGDDRHKNVETDERGSQKMVSRDL